MYLSDIITYVCLILSAAGLVLYFYRQRKLNRLIAQNKAWRRKFNIED